MSHDQATRSSLEEDVSAWEVKVKEARRSKDALKILDVAKQAVADIDQRLSNEAHGEDEAVQRAALLAIKRITYNAAADAWPGWEAESTQMSTATLEEAKALAQRSLDIVRKLRLDDIQFATAVWLVGAFNLALGNLRDADAEFGTATYFYRIGSAPGLSLLARGYTVIARCAQDKASQEETLKSLADTFDEIKSGSFKDGGFWIEQLRTAAKVFSNPA